MINLLCIESVEVDGVTVIRGGSSEDPRIGLQLMVHFLNTEF